MKWIFIYIIKFYKRFVSILFPPSCRFYPSCSQYSIEAFNKHGVMKGIVKSAWRILRCNPFNKGGFDPLT